jgi:uncharacterized protein with NAD-binding domain and iron-sulfur cluster
MATHGTHESRDAEAGRPIKVAVVGGGCAAMAAAFELTRPELGGRYDVTVYQMGWRLGGKGASGRGPAGRIEEHGLHLWMGFYENAFRLMRECYTELNRDPRSCPITTWLDAFAPAPFVGVAERGPDGGWVPWMASLPPSEGLPGDPYSQPPRWSVTEYFGRAVALLRTLFATLRPPGQPVPSRPPTPDASASQGADTIAERLAAFVRYGEMATLAALVEAVELLETMAGALSRYPENLIVRFLDAIARNARAQILSRAEGDLEIRRLWTIADLTLATMRGIFRFGLTTDPRGFDAIDDYDCREWLMLNGASEQSVNSGYMRGLYDFGFSYEDGDASKPRIAAGQALRSMVRAFFTYRGSFFWRMQAGMGDVVFAPLYEVLKRRGVRFEFFHRLDNVRVADLARLRDGESPHVEALEFTVQATTVSGAEYQPLVDVAGLPCWPSMPDYRQLVDGERLAREAWRLESFWETRKARTRTLRVQADFDLVVLGIGLGTIPHVCGEIVARDPRWRAMVDQVRTVATQAFQIWMSTDMQQLGWTAAPITLSGFVEPFDTWADMRHLIPREAWQRAPRALAYFCSVLPDEGAGRETGPEYAASQRERVRRNAIRFLNQDIVHLWPKAARAGGDFRWDLLVAPGTDGDSDPPDETRFATQFWTANVDPSDRYALTLPGSSTYRISPLDRTYDNLTVAGDWTACGFNAGCVEAAVMSGRLAAHAIARTPALEDIIGFDHP